MTKNRLLNEQNWSLIKIVIVLVTKYVSRYFTDHWYIMTDQWPIL